MYTNSWPAIEPKFFCHNSKSFWFNNNVVTVLCNIIRLQMTTQCIIIKQDFLPLKLSGDFCTLSPFWKAGRMVTHKQALCVWVLCRRSLGKCGDANLPPGLMVLQDSSY